ncbi:unnamed protein product, partial [Didymodactylos carnosus]
MKNYSKSLVYYKKHLTLVKCILPANHPDYAKAYNRIANVYEKIGKLEFALKYHEKAFVNQDKYKSKFLANTYKSIAKIYFANNNYLQAIEHFDKALKIHMNNTMKLDEDTIIDTYRRLGRTYIQENNLDMALEQYKKALSFNLHKASIFVDIGHLHRLTGDGKLTMTNMIKGWNCYRKYPSFSETDINNIIYIYDTIGQLHQKKQNYSTALKYYFSKLKIEKLLISSASKSLFTTYHRICMCYYDYGKYRKALKHYFLALKYQTISKLPVRVYVFLAKLLIKLKQYRIALKVLHKGLTLIDEENDEDTTIYSCLGVLYFKMEKYHISLKCFEETLRIQLKCLPQYHSEFSVTYQNLGELYKWKMDYVAALNIFKRARENALMLSNEST